MLYAYALWGFAVAASITVAFVVFCAVVTSAIRRRPYNPRKKDPKK